MILPALYILGFAVIWWCYLGYPIFLSRNARLVQETRTGKAGTFSVLVPTFNEKGRVREKIRNLKRLDYPKGKFQIIFVDGGSTDGTIEEIRRSRFKIVVSRRGGKINDINAVLPRLKSDYVMITDADSVISENTLKEFNAAFNDSKTGAVGAYTRPSRTTGEEQDFWETNNKLRLLESRFLSTSSMIAASYAFKRKLVPRFEDNVIADDLFSTFKVLSKGYLVAYTEKATAIEKRAPSSFSEMMKHKQRKARANIMETTRFLPFLGRGGFWNTIYPTKLLQTVIVPFLLPLFAILSIFYVFYNPLLVLLLVTASVISIGLSPVKSKSGAYGSMKTLLIANLILLYALLSYPFAKGTSRYKKTK
jgi:biofilm PGA synthesis N-glycosyltransferase PgaC